MKKILLISAAISAAISSEASSLEPATFEGMLSSAESYWNGSETAEDYTSGTFKSGSFIFSNRFNHEWGNWGACAYANLTGNVYTTWTNPEEQLFNALGGGHESDTYGVAFYSTWDGDTVVDIDVDEDGVVVPGMWITNSAWVVNAILNGDGMSGPFEQGDKFTAVVTGIAPDNSKTEARFLLADYTSDDSAEHYYVSDWRWMDLSGLGNVKQLLFSVESTKANEWGITTPCYFCFDDLGANPTAVEAIDADTADFQICKIGNEMSINGSVSNFTATAYSSDGKLLAKSHTNNGHTALSIENSGMTIIRIQCAIGAVKSFKVSVP